MKTHRPLRLGSLIREELGQILLREMEFGGVLVTITDVDVSGHLENAKVKVSVLPFTKSENVLRALHKRQGDFQHKLNHKLNIWPMPRIEFVCDAGPAHAAKIEGTILGNREQFEKEDEAQ